MKSFKQLTIGTVLGLSMMLSGGVASATPMLDITGGQAVSPGMAGTAGFSFEVTNTIQINGLGFFDHGADGLTNSHAIGLWTSAGALLASTTVPAGIPGSPTPSADPNGQWIFNSIADLVLNPGTYVVGAQYLANDADFARLTFNGNIVTPTSIPQVNYLAGLQDIVGPLTFPQLPIGLEPSLFGPNVNVVPVNQPVPEPSTMLLLGSGLAGIIAWHARKAKT